jgi:hypothetical protein
MRKTILLVAILLMAAGTNEARAQGFRWGPELSLADDADFGIGARMEFDFAGSPLTLIANGDVFFPGNDITWIELNANLIYNFDLASAPTVTPYAGGGLNIRYASWDNGSLDNDSDTDPGLNLLGGVRFDAGSISPFVEAKFEIEGGDQFVVTGGILF